MENKIIASIVDSIDIATFIGKYTKIEKNMGDCPFCHRESSFFINNKMKMFNCYSCGKRGNVLNFYSMIKNITLSQAVNELGSELGFTVNYEPDANEYYNVDKEQIKNNFFSTLGNTNILHLPSDFVKVMEKFYSIKDKNIFSYGDFKTSRNELNKWIDFRDTILYGGFIDEIIIDEGVETLERFLKEPLAIKRIVLPNSLKEIKDRGLDNLINIEEITIPKNVVSIGEDVFSRCYNLKKIIVDKDNPCYYSLNDNTIVTKTLNELLYCIHNNDTFEIPSGAEIIPTKIFHQYKEIECIIIPDSVKKIGAFAFSEIDINKVYIGKNLEFIDDNAFVNTYVKEFIVDKNNKTFASTSDNKMLIDIKKNKIIKSNSILIDSNLKVIGPNAFNAFCYPFIYIAFPPVDENDVCINDTNNITTIEDNAFYHANIKSIILGNKVSSIGSFAFLCSTVQKVIFPPTIDFLGTDCFSDCTNLKEVILPNNLQEIPDGMFYGCLSLKTIVLPKGIKRIGKNAFKDDERLSTIELNDGLEMIDSFAFCRTNLNDIRIPKTVLFIDPSAFAESEIKTFDVDKDNKIYFVSDDKRKIIEKKSNKIIVNLNEDETGFDEDETGFGGDDLPF